MKEKKADNNLGIVFLIVCCMGAGFLGGKTVGSQIPKEAGFLTFMAYSLFQLLLLFLSFYLQIIVHEGGHMIAGLMTGYRFSSFRIGSWMLLKNHEGYSLRKYSLAGTSGQCLLIPPAKKSDGTYPYKLYHLGGVLLNLITAVLFLAVFCFSSVGNTVRIFFLYLAISGGIYAVINGVPMRMSGIATDGYNVLHIGEEPFALEAMWLQLKINEAQTEGIRLKDLPEEWFGIPENASKNNEIISAIAVFSENRAMDAQDFRKAKEMIATLEKEYSLIGLYQNLLLFDKITLDLIENGTDADVSGLDTRQMKSFRKAMEKFPSVIRTEYAISLLKKKNFARAKKYRDIFNTVAEKYPVKAEIDSETEIMNYLDSCGKEK